MTCWSKNLLHHDGAEESTMGLSVSAVEGQHDAACFIGPAR